MADQSRKRLNSPSRGAAPVAAIIQNERAIDGKDSYSVRFDLQNDIKFHFNGPLGRYGPDCETSDLLDIALSVMFVERDLRKLALTNRVSRIDLTVPVRQVSNWASRRSTLEDLLRFMGGHGQNPSPRAQEARSASFRWHGQRLWPRHPPIGCQFHSTRQFLHKPEARPGADSHRPTICDPISALCHMARQEKQARQECLRIPIFLVLVTRRSGCSQLWCFLYSPIRKWFHGRLGSSLCELFRYEACASEVSPSVQ